MTPRYSSGLLAIGTLILVALVPPAGIDAGGDDEPVRFGRDIRPILSERCFLCHGPDPSSREAELRLDLRAEALQERDGIRPIVPGNPEASEILRRMRAHGTEDVMPPPSAKKPALSEREVALFERWIREGATYEPHWSFTAPKRPAVPDASASSWPRNAVDHFVLVELEQRGLDPAPEADKATLLRRVFLDLTGLPPEPEDLDAFVADADPEAYARWVHRLMHEEPWRSRHAERMATPWLDAARYGDTNGIHMDAGRQMWAWRDWVLSAFRDGLPFDRFVRDQLAGDLIPGATREQLIASGFHRNHVITDEGGAIDEEYRVEYAVDRVNTTGTVFLGLTLGCARCHEHKFDPVSQEEYYRLFAFFNSNDEKGLYSQEPNANRAFEPSMRVPTQDESVELERLRSAVADKKTAIETRSPEDAAAFATFLTAVPAGAGARWNPLPAQSAASTDGATLACLEDGSVRATGVNPVRDTHQLVLRTAETRQRLLLLEALADAEGKGRVGRAQNGNAVLTGIKAMAVSEREPALRMAVEFIWASADNEQQNGDFDVVNVLGNDLGEGWAVDAHRAAGGRAALFLSREPFGFEGGTRLELTLEYRSQHAHHAFGHVRFATSGVLDAALDKLPVADSRWLGTWPYKASSRYAGYDEVFGPERDKTIDPAKKYAPDNYSWVYVEGLADGRRNTNLPQGEVVSFAGKRLYVPSRRTLKAGFSSDDGIQVFLDGERIFERRVDRGVGVDDDTLECVLEPGVHALVLKIVNTGGVGGFQWRGRDAEGTLQGALASALLPAEVRARCVARLDERLFEDWRNEASPEHRTRRREFIALEAELKLLEERVPETMVMRELAEPRQAYVLMRGQYDQPAKDRPVTRGVPAALGSLPQAAPQNRLGLAEWLVSPANPLLARVTVNRYFEMVFGTGLVETSEDFGLQGAWPSHPELLDWLAVEFRESGWNTKHMLELLVTSATYRQSSRLRPEAAEKDPGRRWLSSYPRRRLGAEEIRDQALHLAGLLVEKFGGPSVKPYQPEGLWQEVAMLQSNTRVYEQGEGEALHRRSLYTYWKRACPPPSLLTLDAPTREACVVRRSTTNTPLQALVLMNDVQFVEAARKLAERTLARTGTAGDREILASLFRRVTGRAAERGELNRLESALEAALERYTADASAAAALLSVGASMRDATLPAPRLAALTLLASTLLVLDEVISRR